MSPIELEEGLEFAWRESYSLKSIIKRLSKSRTRLPYMIIGNIGYRFYSKDHAKNK
jgi:hypothetical protein